MVTANPHGLTLEPAAQAFAEATSAPPFLHQLPVEEGRAAVDGVQAGPVAKPEVHEEWVTVEGGPTGQVRARVVRPPDAVGTLPVVLYVHGAGWVFGNARTHDRLVRDLAVGAHAAVVFPEYDRSPEARFPVALEQSWTVARWVVDQGAQHLLDGGRMAVAGDSVGGGMSAALTLMAEERGTVSFVQQVLFYPVTDASFDTDSYHRFAEGYFLSREGMRWFWDQYTTDEAERAGATASPLRAPLERLRGLPPALVVTAEADVLRDEGEAYAARLRAAGVPTVAVRYGGVIHDFVMVDAMHDMPPARAAVAQAAAVLRAELHDTDSGTSPLG